MIERFADEVTEAIYNGNSTKAARRRLPESLWRVALRKLDYLDSAGALRDLASPPGNHLEPLSGDREGQHSIRINEQYRICFTWTVSGPTDVEIVDYH